MATCRSCGEPIFWRRMLSGKLMPIDVDPLLAGDCAASDMVMEIEGELAIPVRAGSVAPTAAVHTSHFATCPEAAAWRRRGQ